MKPPSNTVASGKYTIGDKFVLANSGADYQGYYYEFQGKLFAGREFNIFAPQIIKKVETIENEDFEEGENENFRTRLFSSKTNKFPSIPLHKDEFFGLDPINSSPYNDSFRFFAKKNGTNPILIKEISRETFKSLQSNPLYQTLSISKNNINPTDLDRANKIMVGIKDFLLG